MRKKKKKGEDEKINKKRVGGEDKEKNKNKRKDKEDLKRGSGEKRKIVHFKRKG